MATSELACRLSIERGMSVGTARRPGPADRPRGRRERGRFPRSELDAFLTVMAWAYGDSVGYGRGFQPFETQMRIEFYDEPDGRTRVEVRQWLPEHLVSPD